MHWIPSLEQKFINIVTFSRGDIWKAHSFLWIYLKMSWKNAHGKIRGPCFTEDLIFRFNIIGFDLNILFKYKQMVCSSINWILYCTRSTLWGESKSRLTLITKSLAVSLGFSHLWWRLDYNALWVLHFLIKYAYNVCSSETSTRGIYYCSTSYPLPLYHEGECSVNICSMVDKGNSVIGKKRELLSSARSTCTKVFGTPSLHPSTNKHTHKSSPSWATN